tara:strand:+ start:2769 stop:3266 length:498 start_codon:yes stop_codon:yes gene_type:complete
MQITPYQLTELIDKALINVCFSRGEVKDFLNEWRAWIDVDNEMEIHPKGGIVFVPWEGGIPDACHPLPVEDARDVILAVLSGTNIPSVLLEHEVLLVAESNALGAIDQAPNYASFEESVASYALNAVQSCLPRHHKMVLDHFREVVAANATPGGAKMVSEMTLGA